MYDLTSHKERCYWFSEADLDLCANSYAMQAAWLITCQINVRIQPAYQLLSEAMYALLRSGKQAVVSYSVNNKVEVQQKYLFKGNTQTEVDSVHSSIERKLTNVPISLPSDFARFTEQASVKGNYEVKQLSFDLVKDFRNKSNLVNDQHQTR